MNRSDLIPHARLTMRLPRATSKSPPVAEEPRESLVPSGDEAVSC